MAQDTVYNAALVSVTLDGELIESPSDGDFVVISPESDLASMAAGLDGGVTISVLNNRIATITLSVRFGTRGSVILHGKLKLLLQGLSGFLFETVVTEIASGSQWSAQKSLVSSQPEVTFGAENPVEEWTILATRVEGDRRELPSTS